MPENKTRVGILSVWREPCLEGEMCICILLEKYVSEVTLQCELVCPVQSLTKVLLEKGLAED